MLDEYFSLDGISSRDAGICLQSPLALSGAVPNIAKTTVAGRNGDLLRFDGSYKNRDASVSCFVLRENVNNTVTALSQWLTGNAAYRKLEYSEWPEYYMMARITAGPDTDVRARLLAPFDLEFDCKPQRFLKSGELQITLSEPGTLYNSGFPALPLITVYGSGSGTLTAGGVTMQLKAIDEYVTLDCDLQDAYKGLTNKNSTIYAPEFPVLKPGENLITWTGGVTRVEITPRWWTL